MSSVLSCAYLNLESLLACKQAEGGTLSSCRGSRWSAFMSSGRRWSSCMSSGRRWSSCMSSGRGSARPDASLRTPWRSAVSLSEVNQYTLIKRIKFSSYIRKFRGSYKVIYEERFPNIWGNAQIFPHTYMRRPLVIHIWLCNCSTLNFLIYEENLLFFFISAWSLAKNSVRYFLQSFKLNALKI